MKKLETLKAQLLADTDTRAAYEAQAGGCRAVVRLEHA